MLLNLLVIPELDEYIYEFAEKNDVQVFITTHSHVAINAFYDKDDAGIFHVYKQDGRAFVKRIESYLDKTRILDDLGMMSWVTKGKKRCGAYDLGEHGWYAGCEETSYGTRQADL